MKAKKIGLSIIIAAIIMSTATAKTKAKASVNAKGGLVAVYTDWQGAAVGAAIPDWVKEVVSAGNEDELRKLVGKPDGYRVWAIQAIGEDLDALKILTESFDIQASVSKSISQNIAEVARRHAEVEGPNSSATIKEQKAAIDTLVNTNVTLRGLERITAYWTKYYMGDKKGRMTANSKERYMYIVIMGMSGDNFNKQLADSIKKSAENTSEDKFLRKLSDLVVADIVKPSEVIMSASVTGEVAIEN